MVYEEQLVEPTGCDPVVNGFDSRRAPSRKNITGSIEESGRPHLPVTKGIAGSNPAGAVEPNGCVIFPHLMGEWCSGAYLG